MGQSWATLAIVTGLSIHQHQRIQRLNTVYSNCKPG
jgi:hypothetical protein